MKPSEYVSTIADLITIIGALTGAIAAIGGTVAAIGGSSNWISGTTQSFSFFLGGAGFPMRLIAFVAITSVLGWGFGAIIARFSIAKKEGLAVICHVSAICWAGLLVGTAAWVASSEENGAFPESLTFTLIGLGLIFRLSMLQFSAGTSRVETRATQIRSEAILFFAVATIFVLILTELSVK